MAETALERARKQMEQLKAKLQRLERRESEVERKMDTRRKVIIGGGLLERATRDPAASAMLQAVLDDVSRENDKRAFEGWKKPSLKTGRAPDDGASG